jgi:hypothetical protein
MLRAVGDGAPVRELVVLAGTRWAVVQRSFYALLARQFLTLRARLAVPASAWTAVIDEATRALPATSPEPEAQVAGSAATALEGRGGEAPRGGCGAAAAGASQAGVALPSRSGGPDFVGAGVGWRGAAARPRSTDAQQCLELARAEMDRGNLNGALALLRRALALAPGDAEIAGVLGRLAFRDRLGGR